MHGEGVVRPVARRRGEGQAVGDLDQPPLPVGALPQAVGLRGRRRPLHPGGAVGVDLAQHVELQGDDDGVPLDRRPARRGGAGVVDRDARVVAPARALLGREEAPGDAVRVARAALRGEEAEHDRLRGGVGLRAGRQHADRLGTALLGRDRPRLLDPARQRQAAAAQSSRAVVRAVVRVVGSPAARRLTGASPGRAAQRPGAASPGAAVRAAAGCRRRPAPPRAAAG